VDRLDVSLAELRQRRGSKWTSYGPDVLPAWVADMDFPIAEPIAAALREVLERNDTGYPAAESLQALGVAFAERMSERYGWEPVPPKTQPVGDLIQALAASVATFCAPGEGVVLQTPIYPPFLQCVEMLGRRVLDNPLRRSPDRYEMDLEGLRDAIDDTTRLVLLCNPHNPTGRVFERRELEGLAALAMERDLIVVSDEVHSDLAYAPAAHIPFASLGPEVAARTITITAATKAFNIAGLKCALIHFGSKELRDRQQATFHPRVLGVPNVFGIEATLAAWRSGEPWLTAVVEQLTANRDHLARFFADRLPDVGFLPPEASYLAWLDCSALQLSARPQPFFLEQAGVALSDGREFSDRTDAFVRLNFATAPSVLEEVLERMSTATTRALSAPPTGGRRRGHAGGLTSGG
jgi:cystathionine beta-lyase